jgi:hypothetical protein
MRTHKVLAAGAAVLGLALLFLAPGHAADDKDKDMRAALDKLVKSGTDKPDDLSKAGADFAKANKIDNENIKDVMDFLGKRDDKSPQVWGVGGKPGEIKPDNIEMKIRELAKKQLTKDQVKTEADALVEMANRTAAVAAVARASAPAKALPDKDPKDWKKYSEDMSKMAREFAKAVESKDAKAIKTAANNLNATCSDCHGKFRGD